MLKQKQKYVIGIDGGGTKTFIALADLNSKILKIVRAGPSAPRNIGIEQTAKTIAQGINKVLKKELSSLNIGSIFIGLPGVEEEYRTKIKQIKKEISKELSFYDLELSSLIEIGSDQLVAFRSGTDEKNGVVLIAGTGCVVHAWQNGKEAKASGWGWLADEGSAIWTGQQVFQTILKDIDGRGLKTLLTEQVLKKLRIKTPEKLVEKVYQDKSFSLIANFSLVCDRAAQKGDKIARDILKQAGQEASLAAYTVIKKIGFRKRFPLVLIGSMFKSEDFKTAFEISIKKMSKANLIYTKALPVKGAINLAIESYAKKI